MLTPSVIRARMERSSKDIVNAVETDREQEMVETVIECVMAIEDHATMYTRCISTTEERQGLSTIVMDTITEAVSASMMKATDAAAVLVKRQRGPPSLTFLQPRGSSASGLSP